VKKGNILISPEGATGKKFLIDNSQQFLNKMKRLFSWLLSLAMYFTRQGFALITV